MIHIGKFNNVKWKNLTIFQTEKDLQLVPIQNCYLKCAWFLKESLTDIKHVKCI